MSIPKQGTRRIVVAEEPFIWLIRRQATNAQADYPDTYLHVAVEHAQEAGSTLIIITDRPHPEGCVAPSEINPVMPSDVKVWIEQALSIGWLPKQTGKPFKVRVVSNYIETIVGIRQGLNELAGGKSVAAIPALETLRSKLQQSRIESQ
jgi:hypothetical protein